MERIDLIDFYLIYSNDRLYDQRVTKKYVLPLAEYVYVRSRFVENLFVFSYVQVIEDNLTIVMFDAHGSIGQDENYLKSNSQDWLERQYQDYIKVAQ